MSVKIASEIDNLTSRSKERSRKADEVKGQLQRSARSRPAPWGCRDLREEGMCEMESEGNSVDILAKKDKSKATRHDESLSEGEIVSESEPDEIVSPDQSKRQCVSESSRQTNVERRSQERRDVRQSPRLKSSRLTRARDVRRRDEVKSKDDRFSVGSGERTRGRKRRP